MVEDDKADEEAEGMVKEVTKVLLEWGEPLQMWSMQENIWPSWKSEWSQALSLWRESTQVCTMQQNIWMGKSS